MHGTDLKMNKKSTCKLSIKMLIKRKTRPGKSYACQMLLSFKTLVTYDLFLTSRQTFVSVVKQLSLDITRFFAGHCPMSVAVIQAIINICISYMPELFVTTAKDVTIREWLENYTKYELVYKFTHGAVIARYYYMWCVARFGIKCLKSFEWLAKTPL